MWGARTNVGPPGRTRVAESESERARVRTVLEKGASGQAIRWETKQRRSGR